MSRELLQKVIDQGVAGNLNKFFQDISNSYSELEDNLPEYDGNGFTDFQAIGEITFSAVEKLVVVTANVAGDLTERSGKKAQYEIAKKILKKYMRYDAGIFVFSDLKTKNFRFSLVYGQAEGTKKSWSNFRRFTYYASPELTNNTFKVRIGTCEFLNLELIKDAFSAEKVTKDFYKQIADWYFWAVQNVTFPKDAEQESNGRNISVIRMITRLIFIWFMKERGLVSAQLFNSDRISKLLKDISIDGSSYYKAVLQNLFFATLNTKIEDREFRFKPSYQGKNKDYMDHSIYRYESYFKNQEDMLEVFKNIPFLNGGLFDCLDRRINEDGKNTEIRIDGFTDKEVGLNVPNLVFFSDEIEADLNEEYGTNNKTYKVQGLLNILSAYNFTIDENDPNDQEVALDPELLGKVFENLLASFNPETATTARKATGSYNTPRDIVDYMVTQSLNQYYKSHLQDIADIENKLNKLFSTTSEEQQNPFGVTDTARIVKLTDDLRIVDPAVGSGAFPMGILNKLVFILSKLDPDNKLWKETQIKAVEGVPDPITKRQLKEQIEVRFTEKNSDYGRKLYLIQNCIYGVDIQQIAIEIAKLRFFIALLVDEKINKSKYNWGIEPLPNLDFKLMQGNSLISEFMGIDLDAKDTKSYGKLIKDEMDILIQELRTRKSEHQNEPDRDKKKHLLTEIETLITQIFEEKLKNQKSEYFNKLKAIEKKYAVISNVQQRNESINKDTATLNRNYKFDLGLVEKQLKEFTSGLKVKPFFAWKLYFAEVFQEKNGFDIVVANPPYIQLQKDGGKLADLYKNCGYKTFERTGDIYALFYEKGINLLKEKGRLCFITSNKWMRAGYGESLRNYFLTKNPQQLIDLGPGIFENATVDTNILVIQNAPNSNSLKGLTLTAEAKDKDLTEYINRNAVILPQMTGNVWYIGSDAEQRLKEKIEKNGKQLKDWDVKIYRGVVTGLNEAFIIDTATKERLCKEDPKSAEILKPLLRGRDVKRYGYEWAGLWLIQSGFDINITILYPAVYKYLKRFEEKAKIRDDQGKNWWNLRACIYYPAFEREKIAWSDIATEPLFTLLPKGFYFNNTVYMILSDENRLFICGVLNSKVNNWYFPQVATDLGKSGSRYFKQFVELIPIPPVTTQNCHIVEKIEVAVEQILAGKKRNIKADTKGLEGQIDQMAYELYGLTPEEIAIVEGKK